MDIPRKLPPSLGSSGGGLSQLDNQPEVSSHDQLSPRDDQHNDIQSSHLCPRCQNLKVHGLSSALSRGNQSITVEKLQDGVKVAAHCVK